MMHKLYIIVSTNFCVMVKDKIDSKESKSSSPVAIAKEAIESRPVDAGLPQSLDLSNVLSTERIMAEATRTVLDDAYRQLQMNTVEGALAKSETFKIQEQERVRLAKEEAEKRQQSQKAQQPTSPANPMQPLGGGGLLSGVLNSQVGAERAAILDAALKNLTSDEAKLKFMTDHPEFLQSQTSPFPSFVQPTPTQPAPSPVNQQLSPSSPSIMDLVALMASQFKAGLDVARASAPPANTQVDVVTLTDKFRDMMDASNKQYESLIKSIQDQNHTQMERVNQTVLDQQKALADAQNRLIEMQVKMIESEKEAWKERAAQYEIIAKQPKNIPITELRQVVAQLRDGGVPVNLDTIEREKLRAESAREDKKLDHQLKMEDKQLELARLDAERRASAFSAVNAVIGSFIESKKVKNHNPSDTAKAIAGGF